MKVHQDRHRDLFGMTTEGTSHIYFHKDKKKGNLKFENYFYTENEERKIKLKKINEKEFLES